jgi:hypothetical protein
VDTHPLDLLDDLDLAGAAGAARAWVFMRRGVQLIPRPLAQVAHEAVAVAAAYRQGTASEADLVAAREQCWTYMGGRSCEFDDPDVNAMRAVICILFPAIDDPFETLGAFIEFCLDAGTSEEALTGTLLSVFSRGGQ